METPLLYFVHSTTHHHYLATRALALKDQQSTSTSLANVLDKANGVGCKV
jgi:hypothetical protein